MAIDGALQEAVNRQLWPENTSAPFEELSYAHISALAHKLADDFPQYVKVRETGERLYMCCTALSSSTACNGVGSGAWMIASSDPYRRISALVAGEIGTSLVQSCISSVVELKAVCGSWNKEQTRRGLETRQNRLQTTKRCCRAISNAVDSSHRVYGHSFDTMAMPQQPD